MNQLLIKIGLILWLMQCLSCESQPILTGLDVISQSQFQAIHGKSIALVVNHTSQDQYGKHLIDLIGEYKNISIKTIFSPEHGFTGNISAGQHVDNQETDNIKIVSLYGNKKRPTQKDVEDIDIIVFDIQDIGSRYYTYISTLTYIMDAAAEYQIPIIVLDRPNPLGRTISGPILDLHYSSFVGMHPIPIRHGMTIGELAMMINQEKWLSSGIEADLSVIKLKNWNTQIGYFDIPPSPNIPDFETALLYSGICLIEGTNLSEGRGTDYPFKIMGAPWLNSQKVIEYLNELKIPGVTFSAYEFMPVSMFEKALYPKYKGEKCQGIKIEITDINQIKPLELTIDILRIIKHIHPKEFYFLSNNFIDKLYGSNHLRNFINGKINNLNINQNVKFFEEIRQKYLLY